MYCNINMANYFIQKKDSNELKQTFYNDVIEVDLAGITFVFEMI